MASRCFHCHKSQATRKEAVLACLNNESRLVIISGIQDLIRDCSKRNTATEGEKCICYNNSLSAVPTSSPSLNLTSPSKQSATLPKSVSSAVSKSLQQSVTEFTKVIANIESPTFVLITTAVVSEEDDDADDTDHVPSNTPSVSDEPKKDSDAMSIEL
ncbi:hypothetical protein RMATCC62417_13528 [Rhizopus microsporus]|nr:hypothetical protein RMATCC62417_13528 [Rhizopus microsporus]